MAPTAPRPTPHDDALLDRTGIICASGHGPAAPPTPGMNRSGVAGFVAFVVMVFAAVTGVSGLESNDGSSRLVAGGETTQAVPHTMDGAGPGGQNPDNLEMGADQGSGGGAGHERPQSTEDQAGTDAAAVAPDSGVVPAESVSSAASAETAESARVTAEVHPDVPADAALAQGLRDRTSGATQADGATQARRLAGAQPAGQAQGSPDQRIRLSGQDLRRDIEHGGIEHGGDHGQSSHTGVNDLERLLDLLVGKASGHEAVADAPEPETEQSKDVGSERPEPAPENARPAAQSGDADGGVTSGDDDAEAAERGVSTHGTGEHRSEDGVGDRSHREGTYEAHGVDGVHDVERIHDIEEAHEAAEAYAGTYVDDVHGSVHDYGDDGVGR